MLHLRMLALGSALALCWAAALGHAMELDLGEGTKATLDPQTGMWTSIEPRSGGNLAQGRRQAPVEVCDLEAGPKFVPAIGPMDPSGRQSAVLGELALAVDVTYKQLDGRVRAKATVTNKTGRDRGLVVRFCMPVDAVRWQWWDDVQTAQPIKTGEVYQNVHAIRHFADLPEFRDRPATKLGYHSRNFCAAISGNAALALAFPLDEPRICRLTYDANERLFYLAFDLALSRHTRPANQACVSAIFYACDPKWGLRSALSKYYGWHPELFTKHVKEEGAWMAFSNLATIDNVNEFGFQFQEGASNPGYDDKLGVYSLTYFTHAGLFAWIPNYDPEKEPPASRERMVAAMTEQFERTTRIKGMFGAVGLGDADGELKIQRTSVYGHLISQFNLDPELPYGRHQFDRMEGVFESHRKRGGELDGFYYDGMTSGINYRTDHFQHADYPPVWDPSAKKPLLYNYFSSVEFAKEAARRLHAMGKYTMMNGAMASSPFAAPHLDIMGAETGLHIGRSSFNYVRMICRSKPFVTLLKGNFSNYTHEDIELFMRRCVAYGVYPGFFDWAPSGLGPGSQYWGHAEWYERDRLLFRRYVPICRWLNSAGWDPLTHATCSSPDVQVERFGARYFALLNDTSSQVQGSLAIDTKALGVDRPGLVVIDEVARVALSAAAEPGRLTIPIALDPGQLAVLHVTGKREFARRHVAEIERILAERTRMAEIDKARPEIPVHWPSYGPRLGRAQHDAGQCLVFDNTATRASRGVSQWVMLYQRRPAALEIRARIKAQGLVGKPDNNFAILATVCHVTKFTKRVKKVFPLPRGDYDWRDVRFTIESDRPVRSIHLALVLTRLPGRAAIDDVVVADANKPDVNYAVDSGMEQWYEQPSAEQAKALNAQCGRVEAATGRVRAAIEAQAYDQTAVISACSQTLAAVAAVTGWIEASKLNNPCRRALRDMDDVRGHTQLVLTTLAGLTGPTIELSGPAIPGREFVVSIDARKAGGPAQVRHVSLDAPTGWEVRDIGKATAPAAHRFAVRVPRDAALGQTGRLAATAKVMAAPDVWVDLAQARTVRVSRAIEAGLRQWGGEALRLDVTNNCSRPMPVRYNVVCPTGWQAQPPAAELTCPANQTESVTVALKPLAATQPGAYRFAAKVTSPGDEFDAQGPAADIQFVPSRLNLLKNAGFEKVKASQPGAAVLQPSNWGAYTDGCAIDEAVAHTGRRSLKLDNPEPAKRGVSQSITLRQKHRGPIIVRGWSKAERVAANAGRDYSLYVDIYHMDGTALYGQTIQFGAGTHDWVFGELIIEPRKPIRNINVYALHRRVKGTVWFDDLFVAELPGRKGNLAGSAKVSVDSFYSNYAATPLNDGLTQTEGLHWTDADWASADEAKPHWIELTFPAPVLTSRVVVHWSMDAGVPRTSADLVVQVPADGGWQEAKRVRLDEPASATAVRLDKPVQGRKIRLWQPPGAGPQGRPNLMWVREVEVYSR